jgi:hypothetical protein
MAIVVRWKADGDYLCGLGFCERERPTLLWSKRQQDARRFNSRRHALEEMHAHVGVAEEILASGSKFLRLAPKRRVEQASADPVACDIGRFIIESTSQKSMYAMNLAEHILWRLRHVHGFAPREAAPEKHTEIINGGVKVTAPETMTLGEVWDALSSSPALRVCLDGETRRAAAEARETWRAEAKAEMCQRVATVVGRWDVSAEKAGDTAESSRNLETKTRFFSRADTYRVCAREVREALGIEPRADAAGRAVENLDVLAPKVERATTEREEAPSGMHIERRGDCEYLVGAPDVANKCCATGPNPKRFICTYHHAGEHVATYPCDGAEFICERWPITEASQ